MYIGNASVGNSQGGVRWTGGFVSEQYVQAVMDIQQEIRYGNGKEKSKSSR